MLFSIIIPSFNQGKYIRKTFENLIELKEKASEESIQIEILLFDNKSDSDVQTIIAEYAQHLSYCEIENDKGQFDAINKGILKCKGDYWTWLNTDDYIHIEGFISLAKILQNNPETDYIYGSINYMDENDKLLFTVKSLPLSLSILIHKTPGIFQPGSFFKKSFTDKIGLLKPYRCCFDYEYILRCLKNNAKLIQCDFPVAYFRYYAQSKTGSLIPVFIKEQLIISAEYGRKSLSFLTIFSYLRLLKHKIFPGK
jgi:glycosyltransferase involved in cell wall biosynthesis